MSIQDLVSKSLDDIRQDLFDRITEKQTEYQAKGWLPAALNLNKGIVRGLLELWAWGLYLLYQFLAKVLLQAYPDTATGGWLRLHCKQVDVFELELAKAVHTVYFTREASVGNVVIAAGRIVRTKPDGAGNVYRFISTERVVLQDGETEVAATVEAEEYGTASNVTAGQICEIVTTITGVDGVENRADSLVSEGVDTESDDSLRLRYQLAWKALSGCTKAAYEAWARQIAGVVAVKILDQHPRGEGTVDVVITGTGGLPTQALLDKVDAKVIANRPINDDTLVKAPTAVPVDIVAELELTAGDAATILAEAEERERALFAASTIVEGITPFAIGQDGTVDRLAWAMLGIDGIKKINWTSPAADIDVDEDGLLVLNSIALTYVWSAE